MNTIKRPTFLSVPLSVGLNWTGSGPWRFEEKLDGRWHELGIGQSRIVGELMKSGEFFAFDIPIYNGADIRGKPLRERLVILDTFPLLRPAVGDGREFLSAVLERGGEGVVAKNLEAPFGVELYKCKRNETHDCTVTEKNPARGSIHLTLDGEDVGWCPAHSAFEKIQVGYTVEIVAFGRHASGKFREARIARDECGQPKIRWDKMESESTANE